MRIIAGEHRGRRIAAPPGLDTRPMLDRVREALFSTLGERIDGARVLDLFAGSGSLGLEALSRGSRSVRMIERDARALAILRENVELLGLSDRARIVRGDALRTELWRPRLSVEPSSSPGTSSSIEPSSSPAPSRSTDEGRFDVVFLDPPYAVVEEPVPRMRLLERVETLMKEHVRPDGVLVIHAPARALEMLRTLGAWRRDVRRYGSSGLLYLFGTPGGRGAGTPGGREPGTPGGGETGGS